jgi:hypothetical protein
MPQKLKRATRRTESFPRDTAAISSHAAYAVPHLKLVVTSPGMRDLPWPVSYDLASRALARAGQLGALDAFDMLSCTS